MVDDDRHVLDDLKFYFQDNYKVILCASGKEALSLVDGNTHVVILDISMPDEDGFWTFEQIKKKYLHLPIIFHSAFQNLKDPFQIMNDYRPFGYVSKSAGSSQLKDSVISAVEYYKHILDNRLLVEKLQQEITDRRKAEIEKEALITDLEAKHTEIAQIMNILSHDLRTPLFTIKLFLGSLEQNLTRNKMDRLPKDIERIGTSADNMKQLLDELLELPQVGNIVNKPQQIDLTSLFNDVIKLISQKIFQQKLTITFKDQLPSICADRQKMLVVVHHLIDNAIKFTSKQPCPKIEIGAIQKTNEVMVSLVDNGIGIEKKYHERIFRLFEQLNQQIEGTGIGLTLVKRIIEVHGGHVWVESEGLNQGAKFCFTLPFSNKTPKKPKNS